MGTIIEIIKSYFRKKEDGNNEEIAPEGMCPICWGHSEWEGQYYKIKKDKHTLPNGDIYDSFISKIADEHVRTSHNLKTTRVCLTCDKEI